MLERLGLQPHITRYCTIVAWQQSFTSWSVLSTPEKPAANECYNTISNDILIQPQFVARKGRYYDQENSAISICPNGSFRIQCPWWAMPAWDTACHTLESLYRKEVKGMILGVSLSPVSTSATSGGLRSYVCAVKIRELHRAFLSISN